MKTRGSHPRPDRKHPAHHPPIKHHNRTIILFLTVCAHQRQPVLANDTVLLALRSIWASSRQWRVGRYVIIPDHLHLFCSPTSRESENVTHWVAYWKRAVSRALPDHQSLWQRDCWDTQLRHHENYTEKWQYVLNNPVRAELVKHASDWPYQGEIDLLMW